MKTSTSTTKRVRTRIPKSETRKAVDRELAAMDRAYSKVVSSPNGVQAFLQSIGLIDSKGRLTRKYR